MIVPLTKQSESGKSYTYVLTPKEMYLFLDKLNVEYRMRAEMMFQTGMRIAEIYHFVNHPEYFRKENAAIFLPHVKEIGKHKCTIKQRSVLLSPKGVRVVEDFINHKITMPAYQNMEEAFKLAATKAGFDTKYFTPKLTRKSYVSWLMAVFPELKDQISHSAGHDPATMQRYYLTYGWRKEDVKDMRDELKGWGNTE